MSEFDRRFRYRARDHAGQERRGLVDAADLPSAIQALQAKQLVALEVAAVDGAPDGRVMSRRKRRMRDAERIVLLQEMATLLEAGVSVAEALPSMAEAHAAQASGPALAGVRDAVNAGRPLAESLRAAPVIGLPPYALALIEAGEASGTLARAMHSAAEQLEHDRRVAEEMRSALIYPTVLVVVGTLVILTIFIGVVPRFATLISNPRADIPEFSRQVIASAVYVKQHLTAFALGAGAVLALLVASFTGAAGRERLVALALRVPGLRPWMLESDLGRWAGVLGALLGSRVPVIRAIGLSAAAVRVRRLVTGVAGVGRPGAVVTGEAGGHGARIDVRPPRRPRVDDLGMAVDAERHVGGRGDQHTAARLGERQRQRPSLCGSADQQDHSR